MSEATFTITDAALPDEAPPTTAPNGDFDPRYPGSTPEAPYGFKDDGTPYKRHHGPRSGSGRNTGNTPASDKMARTAANLLARGNGLMGIGLMSFGLPMTAAAMADANDTFEELAYQALLNDPDLCRKILGAGAMSGKAGLILAYGSLGMAIAPAAMGEIKAKRRNAANEPPEEGDYDE